MGNGRFKEARTGKGVLRLAPHFEIGEIQNIEELKQIFTGDVDYELNWLFVGIQTASLDDLEWSDDDFADDRAKNQMELDVLVIYPRLRTLLHGQLLVTKADIPWLRNVVSNSVDGVASTQYFNTSFDWRSATPERWAGEAEHNMKWVEHRR